MLVLLVKYYALCLLPSDISFVGPSHNGGFSPTECTPRSQILTLCQARMALWEFRKKLFPEYRTVISLGDKFVCGSPETSFKNIYKFMAVWLCNLFNNEIDIKYMALVCLHHLIIFTTFDRFDARPFYKITK